MRLEIVTDIKRHHIEIHLLTSLLWNFFFFFFITHRLFVWSIKCPKVIKKTHYNFIKSNWTSSNVLLCLNNISKPKEDTVYNETREKHKMLTG